MYKKISKILICALILVLAVGAVSAMESNTVDDAIASDVSDDVATVSEDEIDQVAVEEQEDDIIGTCEEEAVAVSEDADAIAVSENDGSVGIDEGKSTVSLKVDDDKLSSEYGAYSVQYKTFTVGKLKIPKKYVSDKYKDSPMVKKKIQKKMKVLQKKAKKKLYKIMKKGWQLYSEEDPVIKKAGKYYLIRYDMTFYRNV